MAKSFCDARILLVAATVVFIFAQMRLMARQSYYADRLAKAVDSENQCTSKMRSLIDQISVQQGRIVALEEEKRRHDVEYGQLKTRLQYLEGYGWLDYTPRNVASQVWEAQLSLKKEQYIWLIAAKGTGMEKLFSTLKEPVAAVVIMACNRPDYLERTVQSILKYHNPVASKFPLFISQDGVDQNVKSKSLSYKQVKYMQHLELQPVKTERPGELIAYYKIASHYKWSLDKLFKKYNFSHVIILEDDMEIAPDFFDYFEAAAKLLDKDKTLMAVSSWNDNGQKQFVRDHEALYRSDFFPGLGWMLSKSIWDELSPKWPRAYWDDWLRLKENHKNRQFIRPEVCRTYNFGEHGSSMGQFFKQYLEPIKLNDVHVDWKSKDLSYLVEDNFRSHFSSVVSNATPVFGTDVVLKAYNIEGDVRIQYNDQHHFEHIARQFGIFEEWKDGIPRTAYKGVVVFRWQTPRRIFLVGPDSLQQLGIQSM